MKDIMTSPLHIEDAEQFKRGHSTVRISVPTQNRWFIGAYKSLSKVPNETDVFTLRLEQKIAFTPVTGSGSYDPSDPGESLFAKAGLGPIVEDDQGFLLCDPHRVTWPGLSDEFLVVHYKTKNKHIGWAVFTRRMVDLKMVHNTIHPESYDQSQAAA